MRKSIEKTDNVLGAIGLAFQALFIVKPSQFQSAKFSNNKPSPKITSAPTKVL